MSTRAAAPEHLSTCRISMTAPTYFLLHHRALEFFKPFGPPS
jgi:hypothetical protein